MYGTVQYLAKARVLHMSSKGKGQPFWLLKNISLSCDLIFPDMAHYSYGLEDCSIKWVVRQRKNSCQTLQKAVELLAGFSMRIIEKQC